MVVLLKVYANCIDGQQDEVNEQIAAALRGEPERETLPETLAATSRSDANIADQARTGTRTSEAGRDKSAGQPS